MPKTFCHDQPRSELIGAFVRFCVQNFWMVALQARDLRFQTGNQFGIRQIVRPHLSFHSERRLRVTFDRPCRFHQPFDVRFSPKATSSFASRSSPRLRFGAVSHWRLSLSTRSPSIGAAQTRAQRHPPQPTRFLKSSRAAFATSAERR